MMKEHRIRLSEKNCCGIKSAVDDTSVKQYLLNKHVDTVNCYARTTTTDQTLSTDWVRAEQKTDTFVTPYR
jgi:hypothetical protein